MPCNPGIDGGSHEVIVGLGLEADGRAKAVVLGLHDRDEGVAKISGRNFVHRKTLRLLFCTESSALIDNFRRNDSLRLKNRDTAPI
jgi:acetaldehyde dehydrogenase (acetylating)